MILSDHEIEDLCYFNELIKPFNADRLTPNGYDISYEKILKPSYYKHSILPKTHSLLISKEVISMPKDLVASIWLKSSYAQQGIMATFGKIDAGFKGKLRISIYNASNNTIDLFKKDESDKRIAQIVFHQLNSVPHQLYDERSGNYQNYGVKR